MFLPTQMHLRKELYLPKINPFDVSRVQELMYFT